jgi:hypothetical protein
VNLSTVTYKIQLLPAGNVDYGNSSARHILSACFCSCCSICRRKQYISFAAAIVINSNSVIVSITISYLINKTLFRLQCSWFLRLWLASKLRLIHKIITSTRLKRMEIKSVWYKLFTAVRHLTGRPDILRFFWPTTGTVVPHPWT